MHRQLGIYIILISSIPNYVSAVNNFSTFSRGAAASGFNGAYTAIADDYSTTYWNPAGISFVNSINLGGTHSELPLNRSLDFFAIIIPISSRNSVGISWSSFNIKNIEARENNTVEPDYVFNSSDRSFWLSYARRIGRRFSVGINLKLLNSRLDYAKSIGGGLDFSVMIKLFNGFKAGFTSRDLNTKVKWNTGASERIPNVNRFGISGKISKDLLVTADYVQNRHIETLILGTELRILDMIKIRTGMNQETWTFGSGIILPLTSKSFLMLNYAITTDKLIDNQYQHILDFNLKLF
jgi:hypothetical protein